MSEPTAHHSARRRTRAESMWLITLAYVAATIAAIVVGRMAPAMEPIYVAALADLIATVVVFGASFALDNSSVYDPYWSVAPPIIGLYFLSVAADDATFPRQLLCLALVSAWALRLTYNWARGFPGLHHEDFRYVMIREKTGRFYWPVSFLGIHLFPTVQVFLGCLAMYPAMTSSRPLGAIDVIATIVTALAIVYEGLADDQLRAFVQRSGKPAGAVMREGLWAYSRHPNYFGELTFWWGVFLFGFAASPDDAPWMMVGPAAITLMFFVVSLPLIEKRQLARRPAYREVIETTSAIIPWFPKRR